MPDFLLDSDVFIDHIRGARKLSVDPTLAAYSVVTRTELFAGRAEDEEAVRELLLPLTEIEVDRGIAERAGRIRRRARIQTADALIAATALEHRLELVTRNSKDFEMVPGLRVRDPQRL